MDQRAPCKLVGGNRRRKEKRKVCATKFRDELWIRVSGLLQKNKRKGKESKQGSGKRNPPDGGRNAFVRVAD